MKNRVGLIVLAVVLAVGIFLWDYNRVTACPGVAVYYKCRNYFGE